MINLLLIIGIYLFIALCIFISLIIENSKSKKKNIHDKFRDCYDLYSWISLGWLVIFWCLFYLKIVELVRND